MKVIFTFHLPDDQVDYNAARLGPWALATLWEIDQHCRGLLKHGDTGDDSGGDAGSVTARDAAPCSIVRAGHESGQTRARSKHVTG